MTSGRKSKPSTRERTTVHLVVSFDPQTLAALVALIHDASAAETLVTELTARLRHATDALARAVTADRRQTGAQHGETGTR